MKPFLSTTSLRSFPITEAIEAAFRLGYAGVEIWAEHLWDRRENPTDLGRQAAGYGLAVGVHGPSRDLNVTSANRGIRAESQRQYADALATAHALGAQVITFHPGSMSSSRDRSDDYWVPLVDFFTRIGSVAHEQYPSLTVTIENMEERPGEFITDPRDAARLIKATRVPSLGMTFDIAHMLYNRKAIDLSGLEGYIRHVHLSGSTETLVHVPLDEGIYDVRPALRQLTQFYAGGIVIEGYARGREMATVEDNRRIFDQLVGAS